MPNYCASALQKIVVQALIKHNTSEINALSVARALIKAELDGIKTHGLARLNAYCGQAACHKVRAQAVPKVKKITPSAIQVDAGFGFAYPAIDLAIDTLAPMAKEMGIAMATIYRSHHFGVVGHHLERLATQYNIVSMMFGNAPKSIAPWGGKKALFGTNPIAFATPRLSEPPMVIDMSLSKVARGQVMLAEQRGEKIPDDWALDSDGNPTTNPTEAINGTMLPLGAAKGAALVMMVEILSACLTGANFSHEASSFFDNQGEPPGVGQTIIAINPYLFAGAGFLERLEELFSAYLSQENTRLPASRRYQIRAENTQKGIELSEKFYQQIVTLAQ